MTNKDRREIRRRRREQVAVETEARAVAREASWGRRAGRRVFRWWGRRGDLTQVVFDFRTAVVIGFDTQCDSVEDVGAKVSLQQALAHRAEGEPPN